MINSYLCTWFDGGGSLLGVAPGRTGKGSLTSGSGEGTITHGISSSDIKKPSDFIILAEQLMELGQNSSGHTFRLPGQFHSKKIPATRDVKCHTDKHNNGSNIAYSDGHSKFVVSESLTLGGFMLYPDTAAPEKRNANIRNRPAE